MKTLDEVIKALDNCADVNANFEACECCEYRDIRDDGYDCGRLQMMEDALHYLKNYRDSKAWIKLEKKNYTEAVKNCEQTEARYTKAILDMYRNEPLTWDELKEMTGKPVWMEWTGSPRWGIVDGIYKDAFGVENLVVCVPHDYLHFDKRMQGDVWQAYRKER